MLIRKWIPLRSAIAALGAATREKENPTKYLQILLADGPRGNEGRILALLRILLDDHSLGDWAVAKELLLLANVRVPEIVLLHIPMQRLAIAFELMRLLADGSLWAEGIETGREPPEYARISEALWVGAEPYLGERRPHPRIGKTLGIGKTLVDFTCSTLCRRAGLDDMIEINSVRVPTQGLEGLWSAPGVVERMRRTYPALVQAPPDQLGMSVTPRRTGFAGRPSAKHLVAAEMERRAKNGEFKSSMRKEAKELADWYAATHPEGPSTSDGAIRNSLAHLHRRLKAQAAAPPD